jgi:chromosome segregation ATPase
MSPSRILCVLAVSAALACGGENADGNTGSTSKSGATGVTNATVKADADKSVEQLQEEVKTAEKPALETAVDGYKSTLASLDGQKDDLKKQIEDLTAQAKEKLGDMLGGDAAGGEDLQKQIDALQGQMDDLVKEIKSLKAKLDVYVQELASRA